MYNSYIVNKQPWEGLNMNTEETKQPTCEERIDARLKARMAQIYPEIEGVVVEELPEEELKEVAKELSHHLNCEPEDADGYDVRDAMLEEVREMALSVTITKTYDILLSWGGPSDGFKLFHDGESWTGGEYYFQDWFDGAKRQLEAEDAEFIAELFGVYPEEAA